MFDDMLGVVYGVLVYRVCVELVLPSASCRRGLPSSVAHPGESGKRWSRDAALIEFIPSLTLNPWCVFLCY